MARGGRRSSGPGRWFFWVRSRWPFALPSWRLNIRSPAASTSGRGLSSRGVGWMAGWVYLCGSIISLAAVALALQATLPQIAPAFQLIGDSADRASAAANAVILGCVLIAVSTVINSVGVRLLARINNVGVIAELLGVALLIVLLAASIRRGPAILVRHARERTGQRKRLPGSIPGGGAHGVVRDVRLRHGGDAGRGDREPAAASSWAILQALAAAALAGCLLILFRHPGRQRPGLPELGGSPAACRF